MRRERPVLSGTFPQEDAMPYSAKDYTALIGMKGFSETLLKNHFTLYQGYVTNTNKVADALGQMLKEGKTATPEYAELKRRFGWEFNGMRLHELYFDNLKGSGVEKSGPLAKKLEKEFGGIEAWEKDFKACGTMRGIGCTTWSSGITIVVNAMVFALLLYLVNFDLIASYNLLRD